MKNFTCCEVKTALSNRFSDHKLTLKPVIYTNKNQVDRDGHFFYYGFFTGLKSDVKNEIDDITIPFADTENQPVLFTNINDATFSNFQGYMVSSVLTIWDDSQPVSLYTSFSGSTETGVSCGSVGELPVDRLYWHNGEGALPTFGDVVYTDSNGTETLNFLKINTNTDPIYCHENGVVTVENCE